MSVRDVQGRVDAMFARPDDQGDSLPGFARRLVDDVPPVELTANGS